ncbi:low molecular weight protein-tyrosine-phosphatase [Acidihalobacter prosperus]|uniref:Low molecular weight protein tyrosine phosphatase n=1 Tax=Acidihalobacter prosperus TaxID=160660 RepID=A0A1A6C8N6_9GAMM|nr:low molecular weight protein-tyrosine-phosphatase [Acidihalobacter prosperus]OBS10909.1 Low molecular weight protein tyrosine phosphatase [Acidihalobacter prosperus]
MQDIGVLFVCMGNICRSPAAQGVFERQLERAGLAGRVRVDSAGTHAYHVGEPPDRRMQAAARRRGYDLSSQRARRIESADLTRFAHVLVMDQANLDALRDQGLGLQSLPSVQLLMSFAPELGVIEVPDPYYGGGEGFERVLDMVEAAGEGLIAEIRRQLG